MSPRRVSLVQVSFIPCHDRMGRPMYAERIGLLDVHVRPRLRRAFFCCLTPCPQGALMVTDEARLMRRNACQMDGDQPRR